MIKKTVFVLSLFLVFASCSTDVDLYADYKDVPVVYGLIDAAADTNYIKITKAFCSDNDHPINANDIALIYDSSNYSYKLDAFFMELKSTQGQPFRPTGRLFYLDTLNIHNKKACSIHHINGCITLTNDSTPIPTMRNITINYASSTRTVIRLQLRQVSWVGTFL